MIEINLLPAKVLRKERVWSFIVFIGISASLVIFACIFFFFFPKNEEVKSTQIQLAQLKGEVSKSEPILKELQELEDERSKLEARLNIIRDLVVDRVPWPAVLYEISKSLPDSIWLTELTKTTEEKEEVVTIQGCSLDKAVGISRFIENLSKSSLFKEITIPNMSSRIIGKTEVMDFRISCRLQNPAKF